MGTRSFFPIQQREGILRGTSVGQVLSSSPALLAQIKDHWDAWLRAEADVAQGRLPAPDSSERVKGELI